MSDQFSGGAGGSGGGGTVTSVSGTANQIDSTGGATPTLSLDAAITLPGNLTVPTGGTLSASGSGTINATQLGGATFAAPGTIGGTTPSTSTFTETTVKGLGYPAVTITQSGSAGTTEYAYMVVGTDTTGGTRVLAGSTALGNATLTSSNFNIVTIAAWPSTGNYIVPTGSCNVYRMQTGSPATTGLIGTIASCSAGGNIHDTGLTGDSTLPPIDTTSLNAVTGNFQTVNTFSNPAGLTIVAPVANYQYFNKLNITEAITQQPNAIGVFNYFQQNAAGQPNHSYGVYNVSNFLNLNGASGIGMENDAYFVDSTGTNATNVSAIYGNANILGGATNYTSSVSSFSGTLVQFGTGAINVGTNYLSLPPLLFNGGTITNYGGFVALDQGDKASSLGAGFLAFNQTNTSTHSYGFWSASTNQDQMGTLTVTALKAANGTATAPSITFAASSTYGLYSASATSIGFGTGSAAHDSMQFTTAGTLNSISGGVHGWSSSATDATTAADTGISRDSAGVIDIGTGAQGSKAGSINLTNLVATGQITNSVATGTAPLVITSTTPVANLTLAGQPKPVASTTAVTSSNPTINTDQNLIQLSLPAAFFNTLAEPFDIAGSGIYSSTAASQPALTFKAKLCTVSGCGSGTVVPLFNIVTGTLNTTALTNATWNLTGTCVTNATGATGNLVCHGSPGLVVDTGALVSAPDNVYSDTNTATLANIDLTAALFLQFTVAQSVVGASNSYTQQLAAIR